MLRHATMTRRLLFWFLLIAIAPVLIAVVVIYFQRAESIKTEAYSKLSAIRDLKVRKLEWWLDHRGGDLRSIAAHLSGEDIEALLTADGATPPDEQVHLRNMLTPYVSNYPDYRELSLIDARTARAWVSTSPSREGLSRAGRAYFADPLATRQLYLSDIYMSKTERIPVMEISVPVFCNQHRGEHVVAVLAARIDLGNSLYRLLGEPVGLGHTGETVLVNRDRVVLNDLRLHPDAPLKLKVQSRPAALAAQGETGVLATRDYRGVDVFAAYSHLPSTGWGVVIKQDLAELHKPIDRMLWQLAIAMVILALVVSFAAVLLARSTTAPVLAIAEVARNIRRGDVSARCDTTQTAELAAMGQSINEMADSLVAQADVQRGLAEISEAMVVANTISGFASRQLKTLMRVTGSHLAGFFRYDQASACFHHVASFGLDADLVRPFRSDILEGQIAGGLESGRISFIDDISSDTVFKFRTVAGEALPKELATIPLLERGKVVAVVTLGTLSHYSREQREILRLSWAGQNAAVSNLLAGEKSDLMAAELRSRNRELGATNSALELQKARLSQQAEELTKLASELDMRRAQVEEAGRLKSEFLSSMSHELRTPLNSIIALSQLMLSSGPGKNRDKETEFVQIIERNGRELLALINDILDLSRVEAGRLEIQSTQVNPRDVIDAAIETIMPTVEQKQLTLELNVVAAPEISSDASRIRQIMLNLLANAVKFTDSGRIDVAIDASDEAVFLSVSDTGIGIAEHNLEAIFDEFRQVDGSTTRSHGGSGLGLAICTKLASLLGGSIGVESDLGKGSTFTLTLPRNPGDVRSKSPHPAARAAGEGTGARPLVLVVDDDAAARELLRTYLHEGGYEVVVARDGREGLRMAQSLQPFAITLDVFMPGMDGWEILNQLKASATTARIPVLMVSVSPDQHTGIALGAAAHVVKPVDKAVLFAELDRFATTRKIERILVVDDDPVVRELIVSAVREKYTNVEQAEDGREALRRMRAEPRPDAMILDLIMPEMDGFAVLDSLRRDPANKDLPVIIVTAKDLSQEDRQLLRASSEQIIEKGDLERALFLDEIGAALTALQVPHRRSPPAPEPTEPAARSVTVDGEARPAHAQVLVVEDNPDNMVTINAILDEIGVSYAGAVNGEEAVQLADEIRPRVVLMDIQLPGLSGLEAAQKIKARAELRAIPIVALTARAMKGDRERILAAGCDDYLAKPIEPDRLQATVRRWLDGEPG